MCLLAVGLAAVFTVRAIVFHVPTNSLLALVTAFGALATGVFIVAAGLAWLTLLHWPCPRCGKRFILGRGNNFPTNRCKHCGLDLSFRPAA